MITELPSIRPPSVQLAGRTRILFVDDEEAVLNGLRRQFHPRRGQWDMYFAQGARQAINVLEKQDMHVIVTDQRMPETTGIELLRDIRNRWPATVRIMLSGQTDPKDLDHDLGSIHQFLDKPCNEARLINAIERTMRWYDLLDSEKLRAVAAGIASLPVVTDSHKQLIAALDHPDSSVDDVARIVAKDVGLSVKLMQMVNSAFFGLPRAVESARDAVSLLGFKTVKFISLAGHVFDALREDEDPHGAIKFLWDRSLDISAAAGWYAKFNHQSQRVVDAARLAGLVSLVGRAVILRCVRNTFDSAQRMMRSQKMTLEEAETLAVGAPQQMVGAYLLGLWAFEPDVIDAVAHQSGPLPLQEKGVAHPLPYLHLARCRQPVNMLIEQFEPNLEYLDGLGLTSLLDEPREEAA
jgi:HD-like signal output (HDOD) protein